MSKKVAIVGYKQTKHTFDSPVSRERMVYELVKSLYGDMGITKDDIDTFIMASNDFTDGRTISEVYIVPRIGAYMKDESKVESDGLNAALYAYMRILSGLYDTALVIGFSMSGSEFRVPMIHSYVMDPAYERPRGLINFYSTAALQAKAYMGKYGFKEEDLAKLTVKNLKNANNNPYAARKEQKPTMDSVLGSRPLYSPLRQAHISAYADGAAAVVLASEKSAKRFTDKPLWITGVGHSMDTYYIGDRDLVRMDSLRAAGEKAYRMAGIKSPKREIDLAELHTNFASEEPVFSEALGLFKEGSGRDVVKSGDSRVDGKLPVNPSGGPLGANPINAAGLIRLVDACAQLNGEAGKNQVKGARTALAHGQDGPGAQQNVVFIVRREK
ncbi:MAG: thiolase family protein [Deltaproteobacteria bacterium]|nr:thiolase family protein [Deltaproteobacteria bacterium]MCL5276262.1 thiolase family protein [Deltaproteobacteria bacterium]